MAEDAWRSTSLITWMEYGNNSNGDSPVLTMQIPSLNASLSIMDADAAVRIEESIAIIEDEHVRGGADAVLGDEAHYGLYNDGLVRMKRQQHGGSKYQCGTPKPTFKQFLHPERQAEQRVFHPQKWQIDEKEFITQRKTFSEIEVGLSFLNVV